MYASLNPHLPALKPPRGSQRLGAALAVALHATAIAAVLSYEPARSAILAAAPIMVEWIAAAKPAEPVKRPLKPKETEPRPKPVEPVAIAAAADDRPAQVEAPSPPPPAPSMAAAQVPVPVTQPIFAADYLDNPSPPYPPVSRRLREEGRVLLRVLVNPGGRADDVQVQSSSGFARLDDAARDTVRQWKFVPAKHGAEAVSAWVLIPVSFKLEG
jgi:periplasmic protein TonB